MRPKPNLSVNRTACNLGLQVPSALRAPAAGYLKRLTNMQRSVGWLWVICFIILCGSTTAHGELFQADSKRLGNPKMDIVVTEV